jgi:site-specific recombinase XerD
MTKDLEKVKKMLKVRGCSDRTVANYISCINRFKKNFKDKEFEKLNEEDILDYLKDYFIDLGLSSCAFNISRAAIKYYYLVNYKKEFSKVLLPQCKTKSRFPVLISKSDFIKIVNSESNIKHKIWLLLGYGSGLRISEVANLKVSDILSKENKIRVIGKGNKERFVPLPKITLKYLRIYWIQNKTKIKDYLFPGIYKNKKKNLHISTTTIQEIFGKIKLNNKLDSSMSFHTLRHSFATEYIKSGGDIWELRTLLGHSSANTTMIYLHMAKDFSTVRSPLNGVSK